MLSERDHQLSALLDLFAQARRGEGRVALVTGPVGGGKTTLLDELARRVVDAGAVVLTATASRAEQDLPLGVLGQLLPGLRGRFAPAADGITAAAALHEKEMLALEAVEGCDRPVMITVDDVHHADEASLYCLFFLIRRLGSARVLVVLTEVEGACPASVTHAELPGEPRAVRLRLERLSQRGVEAVLAERFGRLLARDLAPRFHAITGGNPGLVRGLLEDQRHVARGRVEVGAGYADALLKALYRGTPAMIEVAQGMAVLGDRAEPERLAVLLGSEVVAVDNAVRALARAGVIDEKGFRHPTGRAAVLSSTTAERRAEWQARVSSLPAGDDLPVSAVAKYLLDNGADGDVSGNSWAVSVLRQAAELALLKNDVEFARSCLRLAARAGGDEAAPVAEPAGRDRVAVLPQVARAEVGRAARPEVLVTRWLRRFTGGDDGARPDGQGASGGPDPAELLGRVFDRRSPDTAIVAAEQVLRTSRLDERTVADNAVALTALILTEHLASADFWAELLVAEAAGSRSPMWKSLFSAMRAEIALRRGNLRLAESCARAALTAIPVARWNVGVGIPLGVLVQANSGLGQHDEAGVLLRTPVPKSLVETPFGLGYLQARGRHHHAAGRFEEALADATAIGRLVTGWGVDLPELVQWRTDAARALLRLDRPEEARELAAEQLRSTCRFTVGPRVAALRVLAATSGPEERLELLTRAVDVSQGFDDRLEFARALTDLGRAHQAVGNLGRAEAMLARARQIAKQCGIRGSVDLLFREGDTGRLRLSVDVVAGTGVELSEAEQRVALLAARGLTNRQIAGKLSITVSTVEQHLTKVYRKLKVKSRSDLPAGLGAA